MSAKLVVATLIIHYLVSICNGVLCHQATDTQPCNCELRGTVSGHGRFRRIRAPISTTEANGYCTNNHRKELRREWLSADKRYRIFCGPVVQTRIRKSWWDTTDTEKQRFATAVRQLARNGDYASFQRSHAKNSNAYHGHPPFSPYHRGLLYRFETAVRNLGGEYADFTVPYFDHTVDNAWDIVDVTHNGGYLGGHNSGCLNDGIFARQSQANPDGWQYKTQYDIQSAAGSSGHCLMRDSSMNQNWPKPIAFKNLMLSILNNPTTFGGDDSFFLHGGSNTHAYGHTYIGGFVGQMRSTPHSVDDPMFWLHHSFVDYLWALWQMCKHKEKATDKDAYDGNINEVLNYDGIDVDNLYSGNKIKDMLDLREGQYDRIQYHKGSFFENAHISTMQAILLLVSTQFEFDCAADTYKWFDDSGRRRRMPMDINDKLCKTENIIENLKTLDASKYESKPLLLLEDAVIAECKCNRIITGNRENCEKPTEKYDQCDDRKKYPFKF
eukprot:116471_1